MCICKHYGLPLALIILIVGCGSGNDAPPPTPAVTPTPAQEPAPPPENPVPVSTPTAPSDDTENTDDNPPAPQTDPEPVDDIGPETETPTSPVPEPTTPETDPDAEPEPVVIPPPAIGPQGGDIISGDNYITMISAVLDIFLERSIYDPSTYTLADWSPEFPSEPGDSIQEKVDCYDGGKASRDIVVSDAHDKFSAITTSAFVYEECNRDGIIATGKTDTVQQTTGALGDVEYDFTINNIELPIGIGMFTVKGKEESYDGGNRYEFELYRQENSVTSIGRVGYHDCIYDIATLLQTCDVNYTFTLRDLAAGVTKSFLAQADQVTVTEAYMLGEISIIASDGSGVTLESADTQGLVNLFRVDSSGSGFDTVLPFSDLR